MIQALRDPFGGGRGRTCYILVNEICNGVAVAISQEIFHEINLGRNARCNFAGLLLVVPLFAA